MTIETKSHFRNKRSGLNIRMIKQAPPLSLWLHRVDGPLVAPRELLLEQADPPEPLLGAESFVLIQDQAPEITIMPGILLISTRKIWKKKWYSNFEDLGSETRNQINLKSSDVGELSALHHSFFVPLRNPRRDRSWSSTFDGTHAPGAWNYALCRQPWQ